MDEQKKIFIADDDPDILEILTLMLSMHDYEIHTSINANEIFSHTERPPDLIILDIWMSGVDGRDIFRRLKKNELFRSIPVIFISANAKLKEIAEEYDAIAFIAKPFEMDHMIKTVASVLKKAGSAN